MKKMCENYCIICKPSIEAILMKYMTTGQSSHSLILFIFRFAYVTPIQYNDKKKKGLS